MNKSIRLCILERGVALCLFIFFVFVEPETKCSSQAFSILVSDVRSIVSLTWIAKTVPDAV